MSKTVFNHQIKYVIGIIFTTVSIQLLKYLPYPSSIHKYTMRPLGATKCDYLSIKKYSSNKIPGMPSGHMGTTVFFIAYNYLYYINKIPIKYKYLLYICCFILLYSMGWARYKKKCHNLYQIFIGTVYGGSIGYFLYYF